MQQKKFSKRLNYDVINRLFDDGADKKTKKNSYSDSEDEQSGRGSSYFHSDAETNDVVEEDNHPGTRKRSRVEQSGKARKAKARHASSAGEESGTERGISRPLTDGETDTEGNSWKVGLSLPFGASGGEEDYGDRYGDDGEGIFD